MARWCIYDTHGDPLFKSERLDFETWNELVSHVNSDVDLLDRLEHNWATIHAGSYNEGVLTQAKVALGLAIAEIIQANECDAND